MFYILNIYSLKIGNLYRLQGVKEFVLSYKIKIDKLTYKNSLKGRGTTILKECILLTFISSRHDTNLDNIHSLYRSRYKCQRYNCVLPAFMPLKNWRGAAGLGSYTG